MVGLKEATMNKGANPSAWKKIAKKKKSKANTKLRSAKLPFFVARLKDIVVPDELSKNLDMDVVYEIAESVRAGVRLLHPVLVKRESLDSDSERPKLSLVTGVHRLEAYHLLGRKKIQCKLFHGDELEAEQAALSENFCRKQLSHLDRSIMFARFCEIVIAKRTISGQNVQKKQGRPPGGAAAVA